MEKSNIDIDPGYYKNYIDRVPQNNLLEALDTSLQNLNAINLLDYLKIGDRIYAPDKWTIKDIFQHVIDTERVMGYRALRLARRDDTELPGFDENMFAKNVSTHHRKLEDLIVELILVRKSTVQLFRSMESENWHNKALCSGKVMTPLALGFIIVGHELHHLNIIRERYLPLLQDF